MAMRLSASCAGEVFAVDPIISWSDRGKPIITSDRVTGMETEKTTPDIQVEAWAPTT
jgi:hypothetical protein